MTDFYLIAAPRRHLGLAAAAGLLAALATTAAAAQSGPKPSWAAATVGTSTDLNFPGQVRAVAPDASGNVVVAGTFRGTFTLGGLSVTSAGNQDIFVAKYLTASDTWAWLVRAGGTGFDVANGVAVRGTSIYVVGFIQNNRSNSQDVAFGAQPQYGASATTSFDGFLARYTDAGSTAVFSWSQVLGGAGDDYANGVAVSPLDASVYVTGSQANNQADTNAVLYGGSGAVAGTAGQGGAAANSVSDDLFLAKYTDQGATGTFGWSQVGGGGSGDYGYGVAVSGSSVYVAGSLANNTFNSLAVGFGYTGFSPPTGSQYGASTGMQPDAVLAKYTDNGSSATFRWSQVGGGTAPDVGYGVAVSGSSVYVTGLLSNSWADANAVRFGGSGSAAGTTIQAGATSTTSDDLFLAKYTDQGSTATLGWTQVAGGAGPDLAYGVAVSGNCVYVAGSLSNSSANASGVLLGASNTDGPGTATQAGATATNSTDVLAAGYLDNGPRATLAWSQVGGSTGTDQSYGLALAGPRLYVGGATVTPATYGALTLSAPAGAAVPLLAALNLTATLATAPALVAAPALYPNPAPGPATLSGAAPGTDGQVLDALGRAVATFRTDAGGAATLPAGLAPGVYLVRVGAAVGRWVVQ